MRILIVNSGSSTLKLRVLDGQDLLVASEDLPATAVDARAADPGSPGRDLERVIAGFGPVDAVAHRIVHGGTEFTGPVVVDPPVRQRLAALTGLAPLHQPAGLAAVDAVAALLPDVPAVACFDTAFHATIPAAAATYALPAVWRSRWELRRFGFHGLSHAYVGRRTAELMGRPAEGLRIVSCHLGAGASLAAIRDGRSVDTTMGFTPLEGLVMATRSGSVDPGLVLWLQEHGGLSAAEVSDGLEHRAGLLGLSGSDDMHVVEATAAHGGKAATLAQDVYLHRLRAGIAGMAAAMGGLDALVFTAGVGEHSALVRRRAADGLAFLGVANDDKRNEATTPADREISPDAAAVRSFVVAAREDLEMAREVRLVLAR